MSAGRGILTGLALSTVSCAVTLTVLELVFRAGWFAPPEFRSTAIETRVTTDPRRPNFREPGYEPPAKGDSFRLVVVGDSYAWGDGVHPEDAFPKRLEIRLQAVARDQTFEVVNWSRPGWNTVREVETLEWALPGLDPDVLILTFVLNDPEPTELAERDALLAPAKHRQPAAGASTWLFDHSRLYSWLWTRLENRRQHRALSSYYRGLFEGEHWRECLRALRRLRRMTRERSLPLLVLIFPVFDGPMNEGYAYLDLHQQIRDEVGALGIQVFDLFEVYRGIEGRRLPVTPFTDPHPNELAHRLAADAILDELVAAELLPPIRYRTYRRARSQRTPGSETSPTD